MIYIETPLPCVGGDIVMPTYVYRCKDCAHEFETIQRMIDDPLTICPACKGKISRLLFAPGIVFKGSGFHVNDYPGSKAAGCNVAPSTPDPAPAPTPAPAPAATETKKPEPVASKS